MDSKSVLRPYQRAVIAQLRAETKPYVITILPTGAGKIGMLSAMRPERKRCVR